MLDNDSERAYYYIVLLASEVLVRYTEDATIEIRITIEQIRLLGGPSPDELRERVKKFGSYHWGHAGEMHGLHINARLQSGEWHFLIRGHWKRVQAVQLLLNEPKDLELKQLLYDEEMNRGGPDYRRPQ
ncbi:MAG: hypothetical protein Q7S43_03305 [bacterium]|nr:hypothetical protein [bacterium]